jgi:hypothetical protein
VSGNVAPETEKPFPVTAAAFTVTGALPVELKVTYFVTAELTTTLPNDKLVALTLNVGVDEFNCRANVLDTLLALAVLILAVIVAVCAEVTEETFAVNPALLAFAGTVTDGGTFTAELLLARFTLNPPVGAVALKATVHASVPDPAIEALAQETALRDGAFVVPVPLTLTTVAAPVEESLVIVSCPFAVPAVFGLNCRFTVVAWPGPKVSGKTAPDIVNPVPVRVAALMVTGMPPTEDKVRGFTDCVFTVTLPKAMLLAFMLSVDSAASSFNAKVVVSLLTLAVSVTDCVAATCVAVAVNPTLVDLADTITEAGTETAALLLDRLTFIPPVGAGDFNVTVQVSVPDPVIDACVQESELSTVAFPVPLRPIVVVGACLRLLTIVTSPPMMPWMVGRKCTLKLSAAPGARVTGSLPPSTRVKYFPVT